MHCGFWTLCHSDSGSSGKTGCFSPIRVSTRLRAVPTQRWPWCLRVRPGTAAVISTLQPLYHIHRLESVRGWSHRGYSWAYSGMWLAEFSSWERPLKLDRLRALRKHGASRGRFKDSSYNLVFFREQWKFQLSKELYQPICVFYIGILGIIWRNELSCLKNKTKLT